MEDRRPGSGYLSISSGDRKGWEDSKHRSSTGEGDGEVPPGHTSREVGKQN